MDTTGAERKYPGTKKRNYFQLQQADLANSGRKSEADMHQYFGAPNEFLSGREAPELINQAPAKENDPKDDVVIDEGDEYAECEEPKE